MNETVLLVVLIGVFIVIALVMPHLIMTRTIPKVIRILREHNAVGEERAVAPEDLGLTPKPYLQRMLKAKDHKPRALQLLVRFDIVKQDAEGKVYLCEQALAKTRWSQL